MHFGIYGLKDNQKMLERSERTRVVSRTSLMFCLLAKVYLHFACNMQIGRHMISQDTSQLSFESFERLHFSQCIYILHHRKNKG